MSPLRKKLDTICTKYKVGDMYVFGSRQADIVECVDKGAMVTSAPASDVDIGILPEKGDPWDPQRRVNLTIELEDLFESPRVDLALLPEVDPYLALDIVRGELIYTNEPDRQARYELFVLRRAADLIPFKKERIRMILEQGGR